MNKPNAFSFHRFDRPLSEWEKPHQEFLQKLGKTLYRHSKRRAKFQLKQESICLEEIKGKPHAFYLVPLERFPSQFLILHFPHEFWDMFVNLLNGGQMKSRGGAREMTALDESTLVPFVGDLLKDLEESFPGLGLRLEDRERESSLDGLTLRIGDQKLKKFEISVDLEGQVTLYFALLYPYSTLSTFVAA